MWKRDVSQAFRRVPIDSHHLDLTWVIWAAGDLIWNAQHRGMPFGTVSAVVAWHRVGHALWFLLVHCLKAPVARFVDDYFGASREGVYWTAGRCFSVVSKILGFPTEDGKDADDLIRMVVLGNEVFLHFPGSTINLCVDSAKATKWLQQLLEVLKKEICDPTCAAKFAGRFNFAVSSAGNRVGRAYIAALYMQAYFPMRGWALSSLLRTSLEWWVQYLQLRPPAKFGLGDAGRPTMVTWQDAAGGSRWVAAVICVKEQWFYTRMKTPLEIWQQLLPRNDDQIGYQEFLGVVLALSTFQSHLEGCLWISFIDNMGIMFNVRNGSSDSPEVCLAVGHLWLTLGKLGTDLHAARVESKANIADGPTRDFLDILGYLGATFVPPSLFDWIYDVWHVPMDTALL